MTQLSIKLEDGFRYEFEVKDHHELGWKWWRWTDWEAYEEWPVIPLIFCNDRQCWLCVRVDRRWRWLTPHMLFPLLPNQRAAELVDPSEFVAQLLRDHAKQPTLL